MEAKQDFLERLTARQFAELHEAKRWWRGLSREEQRERFDAFLAQNPGDFRSGWGLDTVSLTHGTVKEIWQSNKQQTDGIR